MDPSHFEPLTLEAPTRVLQGGDSLSRLFHCGADGSKPGGRARVEVIIKRMRA
jgi:hypothetical protein